LGLQSLNLAAENMSDIIAHLQKSFDRH
jgi:hypothetical protein